MELTEGTDYYINKEGMYVFTAQYLLKRGYCCENGCTHCPYEDKKKTKDSKNDDSTNNEKAE